jgi:hypothetical protein
VSQQAFLRAADAAIVADAARDGMADAATYTPPTPPGGAAFPIACMRDDVQVELYGENRSVASTRTELVLFKADFATPARRGGTVVVDGATFVLEALLADDQSMTRWAVAG